MASAPARRRLEALWGSFLHTGTPGPSWPLYDASNDDHFVLDHPSSADTPLDSDICDFWDTLSR